MEHGLIGWIFILVAVMLIFGGKKRIEDLGSGFGGFLREFNKARNEGKEPSQQAPAAKPAKKKAKKKVVTKKKK